MRSASATANDGQLRRAPFAHTWHRWRPTGRFGRRFVLQDVASFGTITGRMASRIKHVMRPFPYTIDAEEDIRVARALMQEHGIRHLPVLREGRLAGLLSERELQIALALLDTLEDVAALPVWDVCTREPVVVDLETSIHDVVVGMAEHHIGSVLVTRSDKLAGIFTTSDVCRLLADAYAEDPPEDVA